MTYDSESTIKNYKSCLRSYFKTFYGAGDLEEQAEKYFIEKRDYEEDVSLFFASIKHRPPKSVTVLLSIVRTFLLDNDVELQSRFWRKIRRRKKGSRAVTQDYVPTKDEFRKIFQYMNLRGRAYYLVLLSSGLRGGEALQLKESDFLLDKDPPQVNIRAEYTKSGNGRTTFISSEAKKVLVEWIKSKKEYPKRYANKNKDHVFPFGKVTDHPAGLHL